MSSTAGHDFDPNDHDESIPEEGERPGTRVEGEEPIVLMRRRDPNGYFDQFGYEWWMPIEGDRATPSRAVEAGELELEKMRKRWPATDRGWAEAKAEGHASSAFARWDIDALIAEVERLRVALSSQTAGEAKIKGWAKASDNGYVVTYDGLPSSGFKPATLIIHESRP